MPLDVEATHVSSSPYTLSAKAKDYTFANKEEAKEDCGVKGDGEKCKLTAAAKPRFDCGVE